MIAVIFLSCSYALEGGETYVNTLVSIWYFNTISNYQDNTIATNEKHIEISLDGLVKIL